MNWRQTSPQHHLLHFLDGISPRTGTAENPVHLGQPLERRIESEQSPAMPCCIWNSGRVPHTRRAKSKRTMNCSPVQRYRDRAKDKDTQKKKLTWKGRRRHSPDASGRGTGGIAARVPWRRSLLTTLPEILEEAPPGSASCSSCPCPGLEVVVCKPLRHFQAASQTGPHPKRRGGLA